MRSLDVEKWVLSRVTEEGKVIPEDSLVEYKQKFIEPAQAARRLAGQANSASGENFLWIVGLDEKLGLIGIENANVADWFAQVQAKFDGVHPDLLNSLAVTVADKSLYALVFSSDRAPYVIRTGLALPSFEVPVRVGTAVRTANQEQLLRILLPSTNDPRGAAISAFMSINNNSKTWQLSCHIKIYFENSAAKSSIVLPLHKISSQVHFTSTDRKFEQLDAIARTDSDLIAANQSEIIVSGPGACTLTLFVDFGDVRSPPSDLGDAVLQLALEPINGLNPLEFVIDFKQTSMKHSYFNDAMTYKRYVGTVRTFA